MRATVKGLTADNEFDWSVRNGASIEVIGWAWRDGQLWAVWRGDCGCVDMLPSWALIMEPHDEGSHAALLERYSGLIAGHPVA